MVLLFVAHLGYCTLASLRVTLSILVLKLDKIDSDELIYTRECAPKRSLHINNYVTRAQYKIKLCRKDTIINMFVPRKLTRLLLSGLLLVIAGSSANEALAQGNGQTPASPNDTITLISPNNVTIAESDDYATQVLGNPADMNDRDDLDFPGEYTYPTVDGLWSATTLTGHASVWIQHQSYDIVYSYAGERDGVNYPIDTRRFTRLRFRMYASQAGSAVLYWYTAHAPVYAPAGNSRFITYQPGWHIYEVDMTAGGPAATGDWTAQNVSGLRLDAPLMSQAIIFSTTGCA